MHNDSNGLEKGPHCDQIGKNARLAVPDLAHNWDNRKHDTASQDGKGYPACRTRDTLRLVIVKAITRFTNLSFQFTAVATGSDTIAERTLQARNDTKSVIVWLVAVAFDGGTDCDAIVVVEVGAREARQAVVLRSLTCLAAGRASLAFTIDAHLQEVLDVTVETTLAR